MDFKVRECIAAGRETGRRILIKDIAKVLFPDSNEHSANTSFCLLAQGKTRRMTADQITDFCRTVGVTPNELLGWHDGRKKAVREAEPEGKQQGSSDTAE